MSINPKPFLESTKMVRRVFAGRPNITASVDLNQQFDCINTAYTRISELAGMLRDNWQVNQKLEKDTVSGNNNVFQSQVNIVKINNDLPALVYFKGIQFNIPTGDQINYSQTFTTAKPEYPTGYLVLVAKKHTVTFAENPVMAGISSTEHPGNLPSSDVILYKDERLVYTNNPSGVVLQAEEENIGIIATVAVQDTSTLNTVVDGTTTSLQFNQSFNRQIIYNAVTPSELMNGYGVMVSDDLLDELNVYDGFIGTMQNPQNNNTAAEVLALQKQYLERKFRYVDIVVKFLNFTIDSMDDRITDLQTQIDALKQQIATVTAGTANIPIGGIVLYFGSLENFENDGKGKDVSGLAIFAICNGLNNTPDLRGRFVVGAISGVPSVGAPPLSNEVNPVANPANPFNGTAPNYAIGQTGGEPAHKLTVPELPVHNHGVFIPFQNGRSDNANDRDVAIPGGTNNASANTGGDQLHNNIPPFFALCMLMRYK